MHGLIKFDHATPGITGADDHRLSDPKITQNQITLFRRVITLFRRVFTLFKITKNSNILHNKGVWGEILKIAHTRWSYSIQLDQQMATKSWSPIPFQERRLLWIAPNHSSGMVRYLDFTKYWITSCNSASGHTLWGISAKSAGRGLEASTSGPATVLLGRQDTGRWCFS